MRSYILCKFWGFQRDFLRNYLVYPAQIFRDNWNCYVLSIFTNFILLASSDNDKPMLCFLDNVYENSTERQERKTFCVSIPWLIGHYTDEQLGLLDIFSTSNLPSVASNPFLFKPHFYFVPTCIHYSNYVYKSTFNATPGYNVMTLLNLILLSIESYREFKCG